MKQNTTTHVLGTLLYVLLTVVLCAADVRASVAIPVKITITADNRYDLFVNGVYVGSQNNVDSPNGWDVPETWSVDMPLGAGTIAVAARDDADLGTGIGLIAKIVVEGGDTIVTDESWKVSEFGPAGWEASGFDDAGWMPAFNEGPFDTIPWSLFAPPISAFVSTGASWIWRGPLTFSNGYGYRNSGGYQFCFFRKRIAITGPTPVTGSSWGEVKARFR